MKRFKRIIAMGAASVLAVFLTLAVGIAPASAASDYDNLLQVTDGITGYSDPPTNAEPVDISSSWWTELQEAENLRAAEPIDVWHNNFLKTFKDIIANHGSYGIYEQYGELTVIGTSDPHAYCSFVGPADTGTFECHAHSGYNFVRQESFYPNAGLSFSCTEYGYNICSENGMKVGAVPVVASGGTYSPFMRDDSSLSTFKFFFMNFDIQYPTGYEGTIIPRSDLTVKNYVALGDSYSSGEGVTPYSAESDNTTNQCHRSDNSYANILNKSMNVDLNMTAFAACSGAVMSDIDNSGQYGEAAQKSRISSSTDIVTVSIGGNDVLFGPTLTECTITHDLPVDWPGTVAEYDEDMCTAAITASAQVVNGVTLNDSGKTFEESLSDTYASIISQGNSDTQFYIVGYPNIFPTYANMSSGCIWGLPLGVGGTSDRAVSEDDIIALRGLLDDISYDMQEAVNNLNNSNVHFVDPRSAFSGHELCTSDPYLIHIDTGGSHKGSYHPNAEGQAMYAIVLGDAIG